MKKFLQLLVTSAFLGLFVLIGASFFHQSTPELIEEPEDKQIEIFNSHLTGYQNGKLSWRVRADYIWTGRSKYLFRADAIENGELYDSKGYIVSDQLSAAKIRVNSKSKTLTAYDGITARFFKKQDRAKQDDTGQHISTNNIFISADQLRYYSANKKTFITDSVKVTQHDAVIVPKEGIVIDLDENVGSVDNGVTMTSDEFKIQADSMEIFIEENYSILKGNLYAERLASEAEDVQDEREKAFQEEKANLKADQLTYHTRSENDLVEAKGNLAIVHGTKKMSGQEGYYNRALKYYELSGDVTFESSDLWWMIDKEKKPTFNNEDMQEAAGLSFQATARKLTFDAETKVLTLLGDVVMTQKDKRIKCEKVVFNGDTQDLILSGRVSVIKDGENEIKTDEIRINLQTEAFRAGTGVQSTFKVNKKKT